MNLPSHFALAAGLILGSPISSLFAQDYITDFTSAGSTLDFNFAPYNGGDVWSLDTAGVGVLNSLQDAPRSPSILLQPPASVATTHLPSWVGQDFVASTTFSLEERGLDIVHGTEAVLGFLLLSETATGKVPGVTNPPDAPGYIAELAVNSGPSGTAPAGRENHLGMIQIRRTGGASASFEPQAAAYADVGAIANGRVYELRVIGVYDGGALTMDMELYDQAGVLLAAQRGVRDAAPLTGEYSGLRHRQWSASGTVDVDYYRFGMTQNVLPPAALPLDKLIALTNVNPVPGAIFHNAAEGLNFTVTAGDGRTIEASDIELYLNGQDVTGGLTFSGASPAWNVSSGALVPGVLYTATMIVRDGDEEAVRTWSFDTLSEEGTVVIEAEDYNFAPWVDCPGNGLANPGTVGGGYIDDPLPSTYDGGYINRDSGEGWAGYVDRVGVPGVDFNSAYSDTAVQGQTVYRWCDMVRTQVTDDFPRAKFADASTAAGVEIPDYHRHNMQPGEWQNYTRNFPPGEYHVYLRASTVSGSPSIRLDRVTGDASTTGQTTSFIGTFTGGASGTYEYIPLADGLGQKAVLSIVGGDSLQTLRLSSVEAGGTVDLNFLVLVPVVEFSPSVVATTPTDKAVDVDPATTIAVTLAHGSSALDPDRISLFVDGEEVTPTLMATAGGYDVAYTPAEPLSAPQQAYAVRVEFDDFAGTGPFHASWTFFTELTFPYENDFTQVGFSHYEYHLPSGQEFILNTEEGYLRYLRTSNNWGAMGRASVKVNDVPDDFYVSSFLTINSSGTTGGATNENVYTMMLLAENRDFRKDGGEDGYAILLEVANNTGGQRQRGRILLRKQTPANVNLAESIPATHLMEYGSTYELRAWGSYDHTGALTLSVQLFDDTGGALGDRIVHVDPEPHTGSYFGFRHRFTDVVASIDTHRFVVGDVTDLYLPPVLISTIPAHGGIGVSPSVTIEAVVSPGSAPLDLGSLVLFLNDAPVSATIDATDPENVVVSYTPGAEFGSQVIHTARIEFDDVDGSGPFSHAWRFYVDHSYAFPYINDFTDVGLSNERHQTNGAVFTLDTGAGSYNYFRPAITGAAISQASVRVEGVNEDFIVSNRFTFNDQGAHGDASVSHTYGIVVLADDPAFLGERYVVQAVSSINTAGGQKTGALVIRKQNADGFVINPAWTVPVENLIVNGVEYELRVIGRYGEFGGELNLEAGLYDANGFLLGDSATLTDWAPYSGPYFGLAHRYIYRGLNVDSHHFSVTSAAGYSEPPAIVSTTPPNAAVGVSSGVTVQAILAPGGSPLDVDSIGLFLNGAPLTPVVDATDPENISVSYTPGELFGSLINQTVTVEFDDLAGSGPYAYSWSFSLDPVYAFPYANDFSEVGLANETHQNASSFTLDPERGVYHFTRPNVGGTAASTASVNIAGVAGEDFLLSHRFTMNNQGLTTDAWSVNEYNLALFGQNADLSGSKYTVHLVASPTTNSAYNLNAGDMNFRRHRPDGGFDQVGWTSNGARLLFEGVEYELRVMGTYNESGHLTMVAGLFQDGNQVGSTRTLVDETPLTGTYFGFSHRFQQGAIDIDSHSFRLTSIPTVLPALGIAREGAGIVLNWSEGGDVVLETAFDLGGPWLPVEGASSPHVVEPTVDRQFFRLRLADF